MIQVLMDINGNKFQCNNSGNSSTLSASMDIVMEKKLGEEARDLKQIIEQLYLIHIYRTFILWLLNVYTFVICTWNILQDRSYYSSWNRPQHFLIEITHLNTIEYILRWDYQIMWRYDLDIVWEYSWYVYDGHLGLLWYWILLWWNLSVAESYVRRLGYQGALPLEIQNWQS